MAEEKFESLRTPPLTYEIGQSMGMSPAQVDAHNKTRLQEVHAFVKSKYEPVNSRCYADVYYHMRSPKLDVEHRQVYDLQIDELLAFTKVENGKKVGMVFDEQHPRRWLEEDLGWNDANAYMDALMKDTKKK